MRDAKRAADGQHVPAATGTVVSPGSATASTPQSACQTPPSTPIAPSPQIKRGNDGCPSWSMLYPDIPAIWRAVFRERTPPERRRRGRQGASTTSLALAANAGARYDRHMPAHDLHATWTGAAAYESWMGRWSRRIARQFVPWLPVPPGRSWLDVGCGTGSLSAAILRAAAPARVTAVDRSVAYVAAARRGLGGARVACAVGDAQALPFPPRTFDAVVSGLLLNFLPDPETAVRDMTRVTRVGGTVSGFVWDYLDGMEIIRSFWEVAARDDPTVSALPEVQRYPICRPEPLRALFAAAGLDAIQVEALGAPAHFRDFADYWQPFLGGQGTAPTYVATLPQERRTALRERLRAALPIALDGRIPLRIRAWAVRGVLAA